MIKRRVSLAQGGVPEPDFNQEEMSYAITLAGGALRYGAIQKRAELAFFLAFCLKQRPIRRVIEIGSAAGGTFAALCAITETDGKLVSIDLPGGKFGGKKVPKLGTLKKFRVGRQQVYSLHADSHIRTVVEQARLLLDGPADILFVDGDHTYEGVMKDYGMYSPLVRSGGIITFHDIAPNKDDPDCDVPKAWKEILKKHGKYREIIDFSDPAPGYGIGMLYKE